MKTTHSLPLVWVTLALAVPGCQFDEGLIIENLRGSVSIPVAAATRSIAGEEVGEEILIEADPRLLGPVYLGLYADVAEANVLEDYPHPTFGPQFQPDQTGDSFPYGGTTVGDLRFSCLPALSCRLTSGRFEDWQSIVDWFELLQAPINDIDGTPVTSGEFLRQRCYDFFNVTSDAEVRVTAYEDRNDDGEINALDLDFVREGEFFVADFELFQQEHFYDTEAEADGCTPGVDCPAFKLWGWMDAPDPNQFEFQTCVEDATFNFQVREYNITFFPGAARPDTLNFPSRYINTGDWVSSDPYEWSDVFSEPELMLDFEVQ